MSSHASINRIFRLVWNGATGSWVPVCEAARGRGKRSIQWLQTLLATWMLALGSGVHAQAPAPTQLPTGGQVTAGSATINTAPNAVMNIDQTTQRAVVDWNTFNVGNAARVNFNQPNANAATLNRVLDSSPSQILGRIVAPGQVILSNPNGVHFGSSASVDVGSLTATTHSLSLADFMAGKATFTRNGAAGSVVNEGELRARLGGYIALLAPEVRNEGVVIARMGTVAMAAGDAITLDFDADRKLAGITVQPSAIATLVENKGAVIAEGGLIVLSARGLDRLQGGVVKNSGLLEATSLSSKGGRVVLEASGDATMDGGRINAAGHTEGGSVTVTGERVGLFGASSIDASGGTGGGDVRIGGGFHGTDATVDNAKQTVVGRDARIDANAIATGRGGRVVVWSDDQTRFAGRVSARGGAQGGAGGTVEVSGKQGLAFVGLVDAGADRGAAGTLLLDPRDITVDAAGASALTAVDQFADTPSTDLVIAPSAITAATNVGTTVTLQANNDITVNSSIISNNVGANNGGNGGTINFQAGRSITLNASVTTDQGNVNFTINDALADGNRVAATPASFTNNSLIDAGTGGTVSITVGTKDQSGAVYTGQVTADNFNITHNGPTAGAIAGQIDLGETEIASNLTITAGQTRNVLNTVGTVTVRGTTTINVGAGDVTITRNTTDLNIVALTNAGNVSINDANAMRFGTSNITGALTASTRGPLAQTGAITVGGLATLTANDNGFGYADPYINLSSANDFQGGVNASVTGTGATGTGGYANFTDANAINFTGVTVATDLTVNTAGAITDSGALTVPQRAYFAAGSGNSITLDQAGNNFNWMRIGSGNNVTLNDINAIEFGNGSGSGASTITGNLAVTAGGTISQYYYDYYNYSPITVGGTANFSTSAATSDLLLGPTHNTYNAGYTAAGNSFGGTVTLATSGAGSWRDILLRNTSSAAGVVAGLTSGHRDVLFYFDSAPTVDVPAMTLSGNLIVDVPSGSITQSGAIVVDNSAGGAGYSTFRAAASGDVTLDNASNDFYRVTVRNGRDITLRDSDALELYGRNYAFVAQRNLSVQTAGAITDGSTNDGLYGIFVNGGTATLNAGSGNNITLDNGYNQWSTVGITAANNMTLNPRYGLTYAASTISGTLYMDSLSGGALSQNAAVTTGGTTTFIDFNAGITLSNANNVFGNLAITNAAAVNIRENDAITQASAWNNGNAITLTTSDDQAITLSQASNVFGNLTITQVNNGSVSPGAVYVRETSDHMTQGSAWTVHGTTRLDSGIYSITLANGNNELGPLQVAGATAGGQSVTIYAKQTVGHDAITDVGSTGAWATGSGTVNLVAYAANGTTAGGGNINLANAANVLGDLYLRATAATITENDSITDGSTAWLTTGNTNLIVANPTGKTITLDNLTNSIGPIGLSTTGTAGTLSSVLVTDNTNLTQASAWVLGTAPTTLDARTNQINLATSGNVLGNVYITTANGTPSSVAITEDDAITQGAVWTLTGVPVTLVAENNKAITLTTAANIMGALTVTGGAVSITENDAITQGGAWTTAGTTTLNAATNAITLANTANVLGNLAINGATTSVTITEDDDITQAAAWTQGTATFTLNAQTHDVLLSQASNQLGDLTITAQNATVTESHAGGITDGNAWTVPGLTTLTAGSANPIVLNSNPASNFGTVSIVSASNADIADTNGIIFGASTVAAAGTLTVTAGGHITQSGAITAPFLRLIGNGYATVTNMANNVGTLAAGFSGGDLNFVNAGTFAVGVISGTSGITIGSNDVSLTSVNGTITGLTTVNASSTSLTVSTGTALTLPQMSIAGAQTYTASTVSGTGITLGGNVTSTSSGAINFMSPVTLGADLTIQSTNSAINFASTLAGATHQLIVNAGSGMAGFTGAVSALGATGDAGAALQLTSSGATFSSTLAANNGLAVTGPVVFTDDVTLANGNAASVFAGQVTLGKIGGMNLSGYDGMTFNNGVVLQNGPATIDSNNSALAFSAGTVSGSYALTLDSGTQTLSGLDRMGANLTSLTVTALNPTIPSGGVTIAGPQTYNATSGSSITLNGNVTSTAAGAITFNNPVTMGASRTVTTADSNIVFASTLDGAYDLTLSSGTGAKTITGAIGGISQLGDGTGAALILQGAGSTLFSSTVAARSGITAAGPVTFTGNVTLANGDTGSTFTGLVTTGGASGNTISGYDGITFDGGLAVTGGAVSVLSNGSTLAFGDAVTGTQNLTLNALSGGAGTVTGLQHVGYTSTLTRLDVTGQTLSLPATGLAVAGPMSFTAAGGITLNGAVGNSSGPATGRIDFFSPVTLATGAVAITTNNAIVNFAGTVDGGQALSVNAGSAQTIFAGAVGLGTALTSVTTDAGGTTAINGGAIRTTGAHLYNDAVTLGAATTLTGVGVTFGSTLNGAQSLIVNNSGATTFGGVVGGSTPLTSIVTDAPGTVVVNTTAVTTSGSQTYNELMTLGSNVSFTGVGITFNNQVDGAYALTANAGSGALNFNANVGDSVPLTSINATGNTMALADVGTTGAQAYTAAGGVVMNGDLVMVNSGVTVTGPTTLGWDVTIDTGAGAGNITFSGPTSTINGAHDLTLTAGTGNVVLGGVVGGITPLTAMTATGYDLTLPGIGTVGDANQSYTALNDITLNQSRTLNAPIAFTADADNDGSGSFILLNGVSLTASNNALSITAADLDLQGSSTLSSGSGLMTLNASGDRNMALGGSDAAGQMTISGSELARMTSSGGLDLKTTGTGWVRVNGITQSQSQNITGTLHLQAQGSGDVGFITAASTFNAVRTTAGGATNVSVNLNATNDAIDFMTPVSVSGASTIHSGGGNIRFHDAVSVDNDLTLTTGNGVLTFDAAVGSNKTLTLNLGGGSVAGLGQLQSALTGLTVNSTSGITLPAFTINGPQVYHTGPVTVTGNLGGVGITFDNLVDVIPAIGTAITLNAGTGTLDFVDLVSFNTTNMTLVGNEIEFARAVTGSGSLAMLPSTGSRNVAIGGSGAPIVGLNLTAAELAWLPIGTLTGLSIGNGAGTGSLDVAGLLNAPGTPLTLNGGGGITQSGGSVKSGTLTLYAAGNAINLANPTTAGANAFGAVGINGTPSAVSLVNTLDITQLGATAWNLGSANVTLNAGTHDIVLNNVGNTFGAVALTGRNGSITEAAATDLGATTLSGNLAVSSTGAVTQSGALAIGGDLAIVTTVNAGNVSLNNTGAAATSIGDTLVGGDYVLTATGDPVSQASGATLQVRGDLTVTGSSIVLGGAGNLVGGTTTLPATSTVEVRQSGVITLGDRSDSGNLTVISERTNRSFGSALVGGSAITLNNAANNITGKISVSASPPSIVTGADLQTGINQTVGTTLVVAGTASFTAESSSAGSLGINLTNAGNQFGVMQLSGNTVNVTNSAAGVTTIGGALATTSLTLTTAGGLVQSGPITTPALDLHSSGAITLTNSANDAGTLAAVSGGNAISYVDANGLDVLSLNAGGAAVSLTAGGAGNLTQSGALTNVGTLSANAGGAVTLTHLSNTIVGLSASTAGTGFTLIDSAGGLNVSGIVRTVTGNESVRTTGDLTLSSGGRLQADAGNVVASAEGGGNFINNSGSSALVVGSGMRWLVYSQTPDLVSGAHTVKGGLTSNFRHYNATYGSYAPGSVAESGNGFIYAAANATLTVGAAITGSPTHVYGDTPTATIGYTISSGLVDSEDNASNIITGGTALYDTALSNTMNAGAYSIKYTGGLTSNYTLVADSNGAAYNVTPAVLIYNANTATRVYGGTDPSFGGTVTGFKLGQDATVLGGSLSWASPAVSTSNAGAYAINGSGYTASNYTFAQAAGNTSAFTITKALLTVTANAATKTYDGVAYSGGNGVAYSGFANSEGAGVLGGTLGYSGTSQGARNAGSYSLTPTGLTSANYDFNYVGSTLTIGQANLVLTTSNVTKTYDGSLAALGTAVATGGTVLFGGDSVSGGSFVFTNAHAGANKTVTVGGVTVNDGNGGGNYTISYANNTTSTINRANLTLSTSDVTKTYDGTLSAAGSANVVSGTLFTNASNGGVQDSLSGGTFAFTDKNAGNANKMVTASGITVNDGNGGANYNVSYANNTTSTIDRAPLTLLASVASRAYDGTTGATLDGYTLSGFIGSETVGALTTSANFSDKNAQVGKTVNIGGVSLVDGTHGGVASNYVVAPTATASGTITPRVLSVNAVVADKVYDGNTSATLQSYGLAGFVGSETVVGVYTGSASFADRNVGQNKGVNITGINLVNGANGGLASNYAVSTSASSNASITPATLQIAGVIALDKVYDGTLVASLNTQAAALTGVVGGDDVNVNTITGMFLDKNVGTAKPISGGTYMLSGAEAGNYVLQQPAGLTASITPRALTVSATGMNKTYDATTAATVVLGDNRIGGDVLNVTSSGASFLDKNVGVGKFVNVSGISISGADAGNYVANTSATAFANIDPITLIVSAIAADKVYDGTRNAVVSLSDNHIGSDVLTFIYGSALFDDKNAGSGKTVTVSGITLSGVDATNYSFNGTATSTASIMPMTLTVAATGRSKLYDGTTLAAVTLSDNRIAGDALTVVADSANFSSATVGVDKGVTVTGLGLSGADAGNYVLASSSANTTADITSSADTWPLPPTLPPVLTPPMPAPGPQLIDPTLTPLPGTSTNTGGGGANTTTTSTTGGGGSGTSSSGGGGTGGGSGGTNTTTTSTTDGGGTSSGGGSGAGGGSSTTTTSTASSRGRSGGGTSSPSSTTGSGGIASSTSSDGGSSSGNVGGSSSPGSSTGSGGSGSSSGSSGSSSTAGETPSNATAAVGEGEGNVAVSLVRAAARDQSGLVSVTVPKSITSSGKGFTFPLPTQVVEAAGSSDVKVSLLSGQSLPSWLRYVPGSKTFVVGTTPAGALPIQVLVQVGKQRWVVIVSERGDR